MKSVDVLLIRVDVSANAAHAFAPRQQGPRGAHFHPQPPPAHYAQAIKTHHAYSAGSMRPKPADLAEIALLLIAKSIKLKGTDVLARLAA